MTNVARAIAVSVLFLLTGITAARADVTVTRTPTSVNIPLGQPTTITITWILTPSCFASPAGGTVSSPNGVIQVGSSQTNAGGSFSRLMTNPGPTATFTDSVMIPASVSTQATSAGIATITYSRTFTSTNNCTFPSTSASVNLAVVSSGAAGFSVSREALSFDNGAPVRVLERKQPLRANAEISFTGSGMLQAQWEIADPTSSSGTPTFRPVGTVRQYLIGGDAQTISSPVLPTDIAGLHLTRLRITDPAPGFESPVIRYFVADPKSAAAKPAVTLGLATPPNQVLLTGDTSFSWDAVPGARAYQIEIYDKPRTAGDTLPDLGNAAAAPVLPQTPPVAGMLVAGGQARTTLSDTARSRLISGQSYFWRVLAIGNDGNVIGESPAREIRIP